jgi:hypothetical protein
MTPAILAAMAADARRLLEAFDFDKNGLGEALMDEAVDQFLIEMDAQVDPDGVPWPPLSEDYAEWKASAAPGEPMAVLYHLMKTPEQLAGERTIAADVATMTYGTSPDARDEAGFFIEGRPPGQPARRFYEFSAACEARFDAILDAHFAKVL